MDVNFKKLKSEAVTPSRGTAGSAGLDITAIEINQFESYIECKTGLAFEIPKGYVGLLFPRSSITTKPLVLGNSDSNV
jgi:dUTP pyrophosphatase